MRFKVVHATAFGFLKDERLEVAPGFTVIYGLNEAGKSTWHAAMYAALCGVRRGPGATTMQTNFRERYKPWSGDRWEVWASLEQDSGRTIELQHDLNGKVACRATDATTGRDISAEMMFEGSPDASTLLGINRQIYHKVACVRQTEILDIFENPQGLQTQLQQTVASPEAKATAAAALQNLKDFKSEKVGLDRANSVRPLAIAKRSVEQADGRLHEARAAHRRYAEMVEEAVQLVAAADQAEKRRRILQSAIWLDEAEKADIKLRKMRELALRHPGGPPRDQADDDALSLAAAAALTDFDRIPAVPDLQGRSAIDLQQQLELLPESPVGDAAPHDSVVAAERVWRGAHAVLEEHDHVARSAESPVSGSAEEEYELRKLADILQTPVPPIPAELEREVAVARQRVASASGLGFRSRLLFGIGGALALGGLIAVLAGFIPGVAPLVGGLALIGAGALSRPSMPLWRAVEEQSKAEASLESASVERARIDEARERATRAAREKGLVPVPEELARHADEMARGRQLSKAAAEAAERRQQLARGERESAEALLHALRERGEQGESDPAVSFDRYLRNCRLRAVQLEQANQRTSLQAELQLRRAQESAAERTRTQRAATLEALHKVAAEVGASGTPKEQAAALREWQNARLERQRASNAAQADWQELTQLRADGSEEERARDITRLRQQAAALDPEGTAASLPLEPNVHERLESAQLAEQEAGSKATASRARYEEFARAMPSVGEAEEQFEIAKAELDAVRDLDGVLDRTIQFLAQAEQRVQRDIAPVLSRAVGPRLANVTANRYARVAVDPANLRVTVFDASNNPHPATSLSHGTSEQVYFLLRVALAELFARSGESVPLLLDDVTVESDRIRTKAILSVLHELSASHQVVLFTQEDDVLEWAQANLVEPNDATRVLN